MLNRAEIGDATVGEVGAFDEDRLRVGGMTEGVALVGVLGVFMLLGMGGVAIL